MAARRCKLVLSKVIIAISVCVLFCKLSPKVFQPFIRETFENSKRLFDQRIFESLPRPTFVLILTYMRSGSSLTGDIVQRSPGAFYIYEPLRKLDHINRSTTSLSYLNGTIRPPPLDFNKEALDIFRSWFTCNITNLYEGTINDLSFLGKSLKASEFVQCIKTGSSGSRDTKKCYDLLKRKCEESSMRVIKTIRIELSTVVELFKSMPNLKIIHLVRDPRATLSSQKRFGRCSTAKGSMEGCVSRHCTRMENDVLEEERLKEKYPDRIMTAFYEKIASHPIDAARELYEFCGTDFTRDAENYVFNITMAGLDNNCGICTTRSNSTEHIDKWKKTIPAPFLDKIQERCKYILKRYRYETFVME